MMTKHAVPVLFLAVAAAFTAPAAIAATKAKHPVAKASAPAHAAPKAQEPVVLTPEQLAIAQRVQVGKINCELGAVVTLSPDAQSAGRFVLELGHSHYAMVPVVSSTGAIRLEDEANGALWLQLGNKSMLMNQKEGKRLADGCMTPDQMQVAQALESNPAPSLFDASKDASVPGQGTELASTAAAKPKSKSKSK
jgi:hypothetical protein